MDIAAPEPRSRDAPFMASRNWSAGFCEPMAKLGRAGTAAGRGASSCDCWLGWIGGCAAAGAAGFAGSPNETDPDGTAIRKASHEAAHQLAFNAGIYRLLKGVPAEMWNEVSIGKTQPTKNPAETKIILAYQGTEIIEMTARQKADKTYGIIYIHYLVHPRTLLKAAAALNQK